MPYPYQRQRNINPLDMGQVPLYENGMDINNTYTTHSGVCVLPLAEDPPTDPAELATYSPVVVLQLHAPYRERQVMYKTIKDSTPPVLPAPVDAGSFVFLNGQTTVHNTLRQDQLGFDWQAVCLYTYIELPPPMPGDGLVLGTPPWIWPAVKDAVGGGSALGAALNPALPTTGAVATAGAEVLLAAAAGNSIDPSQGAYTYQFPSFYPGTFFNNYLVNGGPPTIQNPRAESQSQ